MAHRPALSANAGRPAAASSLSHRSPRSQHISASWHQKFYDDRRRKPVSPEGSGRSVLREYVNLLEFFFDLGDALSAVAELAMLAFIRPSRPTSRTGHYRDRDKAAAIAALLQLLRENPCKVSIRYPCSRHEQLRSIYLIKEIKAQETDIWHY